MKNPICACPHCGTSFNFTVNEDIKKIYKETMSEIDKIKRQYKGTVRFS